MRSTYLDSSAVVKLIVAEAESSALVDALGAWSRHATSLLTRAEVIRAVRRHGRDETRARAVLAGLVTIYPDDRIIEDATQVEPRGLRTLDAVHLATAQLLADDLDAFVTYDQRLAEAADAAGLPVLAPA